MPLSTAPTYNFQAIRLMLEASFDDAELQTFCSDHFPEVYDDFAAGQSRGERVRMTLNYARRRGQLERLIKCVHEVRPEQYSQFETRLRQGERQADDASRGLDTLTEVLANQQGPAVREAARPLQTSFVEARRRITILGHYKEVHDLLHTFQKGPYGLILRAAQHFPADDEAAEELATLEVELAQLGTDFQEVSVKALERADQIRLVQRQIALADQVLRDALKGQDASVLAKATTILRSVIAEQPARFNMYLTRTARELALSASVDAMQEVARRLDGASPEQKTVVLDGADALAGLAISLDTLIQEHDDWQELDDTLRLYDPSGALFAFQLTDAWPTVKGMIEPLYARQAEAWMQESLGDSGQVDAALACKPDPDLRLARQHFRRFRERVRNRFYDVDYSLRQLCERLASLGDSLDAVVRVLQ